MPYNETYKQVLPKAYAGMVADTSPAVIISRTADVAVPFGHAVKDHPTDEHKIALTGAGDTAIKGISVRSQATAADSVNQYPAKDTVAVLLKGAIWVTVSGTVAPGNPVGVTVANGQFVTGSGVTIPGATYETPATAGQLARVRIV